MINKAILDIFIKNKNIKEYLIQYCRIIIFRLNHNETDRRNAFDEVRKVLSLEEFKNIFIEIQDWIYEIHNNRQKG